MLFSLKNILCTWLIKHCKRFQDYADITVTADHLRNNLLMARMFVPGVVCQRNICEANKSCIFIISSYHPNNRLYRTIYLTICHSSSICCLRDNNNFEINFYFVCRRRPWSRKMPAPGQNRNWKLFSSVGHYSDEWNRLRYYWHHIIIWYYNICPCDCHQHQLHGANTSINSTVDTV